MAGARASHLALDGTYCLAEEGSRGPAYRRAGGGVCGGGGEAEAEAQAEAEAEEPRLAYADGAWGFAYGGRTTTPGPPAATPSQDAQPGGAPLAACETGLLRPDRLPPACFGEDFSVAGVGPEVPAVVEVGGPVTVHGAARARGEYRRREDHDARPAYAKPDGSMFLFYSDHLGGWQLSSSLGRGGSISHHDVRAPSPDQLKGDWELHDDRHGAIRPAALKVLGHPPPPTVLLTGWPPRYRRLNGEYRLLEGGGGRPRYGRLLRPRRANVSAVVWHDTAAGEWRVSRGGRAVAGSFAPGAHRPDEVSAWHLLLI